MKNKKWIGILATTFLTVLTISTYVYFFDTEISFEENVDIENAPSGKSLSKIFEKENELLLKEDSMELLKESNQTIDSSAQKDSEIEMLKIKITPKNDETDKIFDKDEVLALLKKVSDDLTKNGYMDFQGISGGGKSFYKTTGITNFVDTVHMVSYGNQYDIDWFKMSEVLDRELDYMLPPGYKEYLGGIDRFSAYQDAEYKSAYYSEYLRTKDNKIFTRSLLFPKDTHVSLEKERKNRVWSQESLSEIPIERNLIHVISANLLGINTLIQSAETNTISAKTVDDFIEISFIVAHKSFEENAKLNQFIFNGYINPEDAQITTRITKSGLLKSIKIIFLPDEKKKYYRTNEAHYFSFSRPQNEITLPIPEAGKRTGINLGDYKFINTKPPKIRINEPKNKELPPLNDEELSEDKPDLKDVRTWGLTFATTTGSGLLHAYDKRDLHTGYIQSIRKGGIEIAERIPNSSLMHFGSNDYLKVPIGDDEYEWDDYYLIVFEGLQDGGTWFEIRDGSNSIDISSIYLETTPKSKGTMIIEEKEGSIHLHKFRYDKDGDGITDAEYSHKNTEEAEE